MDEKRVVVIDDPIDIMLMNIAKGALFSDTILPSGFTVPAAPEGMAYVAEFVDGTCQLVCAPIESRD